jgi:two-component system KDP operon response regulator KdpE
VATETLVEIGTLTIDLARRAITRSGTEIHLTPTEFDLLRVLVTNADRIVTHRHLLEQVWGVYAADNAQQLRVYVNYLRKKIEVDPAHPEIIVTEPGIGYRLHL